MVEIGADVDEMELLPGVAEAVRLINSSGYLAIVCTNQERASERILSVLLFLALLRRFGIVVRSFVKSQTMDIKNSQVTDY